MGNGWVLVWAIKVHKAAFEILSMNVLVVDVGVGNMTVGMMGEGEPRRFPFKPKLTLERMISGVKKIIKGWHVDVVSIGGTAASLTLTAQRDLIHSFRSKEALQ